MSFRLKTILGVALIELVLLSILVWSGLRFIETTNEDAQAGLFLTMDEIEEGRLFWATS